MTDLAARPPWKDVSMERMAGIRMRIETVVNRAIAEGRAASRRDFAERAGLGHGHVNAILNKKSKGTPALKTLDGIAKYGGVSLEYILFGREEPSTQPISTEVNNHRSPAFAPAARAVLELHSFSAEAVEVVRTMLTANFNESHPWTPAEWFEVLVEEYKTRSRAIRRRSA
ncbi:MAG: helix-turn-helix transcriptional regulator [Labilithrix sp.]|nr:helix-turn-helix transcriptional regulator [Labilithrix sp.]